MSSAAGKRKSSSTPPRSSSAKHARFESSWWQRGPIYHVYPRSFADANGDGVGDLKGIESKADYLKSLNVGAVWLSPIFKSPMKDNGYDVADYVDIDPIFGDLQDFKSLVSALHKCEIRVILDFVPNHTSDQHDWFKKSERREKDFEDFYVWKDGVKGTPPNNWKAVFGGSAWTWSDLRQQFYLHQFFKEQPDLNLRNASVVSELKKVLSFWMDLGVDGFRMDAVAHMFEDELFPDEVVLTSKDDYDSVEHKHSFNLPECLDLLAEFRTVLDDKTKRDPKRPRMMLTEAYVSRDELLKYYGSSESPIAHLPLNFGLFNFKKKEDVTAEKMKSLLDPYLSAFRGPPFEWAWPNFNMSNHDNVRAATRFGPQLIDAMNMVLLTLPGTPIAYYGDEIGMTDAPMEAPVDYRDPARTPMQWNGEANAGFTSAKSAWLPVNSNFSEINVAAEEKRGFSHLSIFRKLSAMRSDQLHPLHEAVMAGATELCSRGHVFAFSRTPAVGNEGFVTVVNFGEKGAKAVDLRSALKNLPSRGRVVLSSVIRKSSEVNLSKLGLDPYEGMVISFQVAK